MVSIRGKNMLVKDFLETKCRTPYFHIRVWKKDKLVLEYGEQDKMDRVDILYDAKNELIKNATLLSWDTTTVPSTPVRDTFTNLYMTFSTRVVLNIEFSKEE